GVGPFRPGARPALVSAADPIAAVTRDRHRAVHLRELERDGAGVVEAARLVFEDGRLDPAALRVDAGDFPAKRRVFRLDAGAPREGAVDVDLEDDPLEPGVESEVDRVADLRRRRERKLVVAFREGDAAGDGDVLDRPG